MSTDPQFVSDQRAFNERIITSLDQFGIRYAVGGSVAAMAYSNAPRFTNDVDFMLEASDEMIALLVNEIEKWLVYVDPLETIFEFNLPTGMPISVLDGSLGTKADLFVVKSDGLDVSSMSRLRRKKLYVKPDFLAWFLAPEDVILYKLAYFKLSEGASQKHPKDIHNMLRAVASELDFAYLRHWASETAVLDLWQAIWDEYNIGPDASTA